MSRRTEMLVASVAQHHQAISAHQSQLLAAVTELERRKAWRVDGATSMVAWLVQRCGVSTSTARDWLTAALKLQKLPKFSDALSQGKLSFDQVKPLVEVAKPETDATLAEQATHWSAKQVRELATAARRQSDAQASGTFVRRFLRFDDRRRAFTGVLPQDQYAVVKSSLLARASRRIRQRTPFDQRMADALVALCRADTATDEVADDGAARGQAAGGGATVRRWSCTRTWPSWPAAKADAVGSSTRSVPSLVRWPVAWRATPRSSSRPTGPTVGASTSDAPAATPVTRSASRSAGATRAAVSQGVVTPSSPTSITSHTGSRAVQPT